ncbi:zinc finger protein 512B isoform X6, partial [Silurus meridionalis]
TVAGKFSYGCPYCKAVFVTKVHLQKHKLWNHAERVNMERKISVTTEPMAELKAKTKLQKNHVKETSKKRPMENSPSSPVFLKVRKTQEMSQPSQNGEYTEQKTEKKQQKCSQQQQEKKTLSEAGDSEHEGSSLPPEEDPERMKHRRKQKTPKKFTGEQPSISGTFGMKGMNKVDEKLKVCRTKRPEGASLSKESQKKQLTLDPAKRKLPCQSHAPPLDSEVKDAILEHSEVSCSTCSIVTSKTFPGFKKNLKIFQKVRGTARTYLYLASIIFHTQLYTFNNMQNNCLQVFRCVDMHSYCSDGIKTFMCILKRCIICLIISLKKKKKQPPYNCITMQTDTNSETKPSEGTEQDSKKEEEKGQSLADNAKSDSVIIKMKKKIEEKQENKKDARLEAEEKFLDLERTPSGRVRRRSAQVAVFHLQEIAEDELAKDWGTKRRIKDDLVPDIKRLNYTRPGLPTYNPETLDTWKNEVKEKGFICCPNSSCEAIYSSVSGLKAHLTSCIKGGVIVGKYTCLLCQKEFGSESGVKYHICKTHSQNWFRATSHVSNSKEKDSQSNKLQKDMKNGVAWKKRGRKPKLRLIETASTQEKTMNSSNRPSMNHQTPDSITSSTPVQTSSQNHDCTTSNSDTTPTDGKNLNHNRDLQPPVKKRAKSKK